MPAAKLYCLEKKAEGMNNSMEPFFPFSTTDNGVEWFQLRRALDQPDVLGWPLLTPMKIQMRKCEKCCLEFCSPVNYRRHFRVHRRSLASKKGPHELRNKLGAFWDKLSVEHAKEALSFSDVTLKDIPASSIIMTMASSLRNPGVWALPRAYFKAGVSLLNIIQSKDLEPLISSQGLFDILDDASEKTFLCAGIAESVQTYIFDGETAKSVLEMKNLVASISFIFEHKLVNAWFKDQEKESLRCEKLLVEEEEAAQKRRAAVLEKKKQKKLRQKELKTKEKLNPMTDVEEMHITDENSGSSSPSDLNPCSGCVSTRADSYEQPVQPSDEQCNEKIEIYVDFMSENIQQWESRVRRRRHIASGKGYHPFAHRGLNAQGDRDGVHVSSSFHISVRSRQMHKLGPSNHRDALSKSKVWTKKQKDNGDDCQNLPLQHGDSTAKNQSEMIIGSIPVSLSSHASQEQEYEKRSDSEKDENSAFSMLAASAREFLHQRWKEALASDHVRLSIPDSLVHDSPYATQISKAHLQVAKKGMKLKYIPKQH